MKNINNFNSNKGMYLEKLIENTINFYNNNKIGHFEKRFIPIQITKINKNIVEGYLLKKSYSDFFGLYNKKYIDFEAKQTNNNYFNISQIKDHQLNHLINVNNFGGIAFFIIHFFKENLTFFVPVNFLIKNIELKNKKITLSLFKKHCDLIDLEFPGIINFLKFIK